MRRSLATLRLWFPRFRFPCVRRSATALVAETVISFANILSNLLLLRSWECWRVDIGKDSNEPTDTKATVYESILGHSEVKESANIIVDCNRPTETQGSHFNFSYVCLVVASQDWRGIDKYASAYCRIVLLGAIQPVDFLTLCTGVIKEMVVTTRGY